VIYNQKNKEKPIRDTGFSCVKNKMFINKNLDFTHIHHIILVSKSQYKLYAIKMNRLINL